jgi:hypothetical protein
MCWQMLYLQGLFFTFDFSLPAVVQPAKLVRLDAVVKAVACPRRHRRQATARRRAEHPQPVKARRPLGVPSPVGPS